VFDFEVIRESQFPGWWGKMDCYPTTDRTIILDLDIVIAGNVDFLFEYEGEFCGWQDHQGAYYNGSIFSAAQGFGANIRNAFVANPSGIMGQFYADQEFITSIVGLGDTWQKQAPGRVKSYKFDRLYDGPGDASIVVFHGPPKPHEVNGWVKEFWNAD
jgi:hypothetical protein